MGSWRGWGGLGVLLGLLLWGAGASADITTGLIGHWKFNGNSQDSAGTNHGTAAGGTSFITGQLGQAMSLNGTDGRVSVPFITPPAAFTVAAWVNTSDTANFRTFFAWGQGGGTAHGQQFRISDTATLQYAEFDGTFTSVSSTGTLPISTWRHAAVTYSGTTATLYLQGSQDGTGTVNRSPTLNNLFIGCFGHNANPCASNFWQGGLDDVRLYDRALSSTDITELFNFTEMTAAPRRRPLFMRQGPWPWLETIMPVGWRTMYAR